MEYLYFYIKHKCDFDAGDAASSSGEPASVGYNPTSVIAGLYPTVVCCSAMLTLSPVASHAALHFQFLLDR